MQRKDFLKYAYMRREILENSIENFGDVLDTYRLNTEYQALDLLLMSCKKEVEEIEEELINVLNEDDEKKAQKRKKLFERNSKGDYIYKDLEKSVNKECYNCKTGHDVYYYREHDLFLCNNCEGKF